MCCCEICQTSVNLTSEQIYEIDEENLSSLHHETGICVHKFGFQGWCHVESWMWEEREKLIDSVHSEAVDRFVGPARPPKWLIPPTLLSSHKTIFIIGALQAAKHSQLLGWWTVESLVLDKLGWLLVYFGFLAFLGWVGISSCKWTSHKQTWNLSKILHTQIFRLKVLHRKSA